MRVFKRGKYFHYEFEFEQRRYRGTTRRKSEREAIQIASGIQFNLMKKKAGLSSREPAPTVREFQKTFDRWVEQDIEDGGTRDFYKACYRRFIECNWLADIRLCEIDEPSIERFKTWALSLETVKSKTTVNRYLATLSKALHYATDKLKLMDRVPKIHKFPKSKSCERERDFTFSEAQFATWISAAPEPLRSTSILALECGMSRNELLALQKDAVHLNEAGDQQGLFGFLEIKRGLKRESRKRKLPITVAMRDVLVAAMERSKCRHVLTSPVASSKAISKNTLEGQIRHTRVKTGLPNDVGLHALRHTFLTRAGRLTQNVKALQKLAGHSNPGTTMKYIHPELADIFGIVAAMNPATPKPSSKEKSQRKKVVQNRLA